MKPVYEVYMLTCKLMTASFEQRTVEATLVAVCPGFQIKYRKF
jgi:hypothetical protein